MLADLGKRLDRVLIRDHIEHPRALIACTWRLHACMEHLFDLLLFYRLILELTYTYAVKQIIHHLPPSFTTRPLAAIPGRTSALF